jgi:hypothetical protein
MMLRSVLRPALVRVRDMDDSQLIRHAQAAAAMVNSPSTVTPDAWRRELQECREEWTRRYPREEEGASSANQQPAPRGNSTASPTV